MQKIIHYFSPRRAWLRFFLIISGIGILFWQWILALYSTETPKILFLVDNSLSMTVQDIARENNDGFLSRLATATDFLRDFSLQIPHEIAVMTFARYPTLELPFTTDKNLLRNTISAISPIIYGGGSDFPKALETVKNIYSNTKNIHIFVVTDAEFFEEFDENFSFPNTWNISFLGVWTEKWWWMLQGYDANGKPRYREFEGKNAISKLSKEVLEKLSQKFSASYAVLDDEKNFPALQEELQKQIFSHEKFSHWNFWKILAYLLIISGFLINNFPYQKNNFFIWKEKL